MRVTRTCPTCGYTHTYATQRQAEARHPRHSCDKHRRVTARAQRVAAAAPLRAAVARQRRPCLHPHAQHQHGTRAAYVMDRCRCQACTTANTHDAEARRRQRAYGHDLSVDAAPVRDHLLGLRAEGIGVRLIATLTGLSLRAVRNLTSNDPTLVPTRVRTLTAARVLALSATDARRRGRALVDARPTRRRIDDLLRRGWPAAQIAADLGILPQNLVRTLRVDAVTTATERRVQALHGRLAALTPRQAANAQRLAIQSRGRYYKVSARSTQRRLRALMRLGWNPTGLANDLGIRASRFEQILTASRITVGTASRVDSLYERISHTGPPEPTESARATAQATRDHARDHGWLAPLAWDDIDNDPDPSPPCESRADQNDIDQDDIDEVALERAVRDGLPLAALTAAEQTEAVRRLTERGRSLREIAQQLATNSREISRCRTRLRSAA